MIQQQTLDYQLKFDADMFMITKRLYLEILAQTNYLGDYGKCRKYVREVMFKCMKEVKEVKAFKTKKIHIEL